MNEMLAKDEEVRKIHEESLYIDGLTDAAWNSEYFQKMIDVGFHAVNVTVATPYFVGNQFLPGNGGNSYVVLSFRQT